MKSLILAPLAALALTLAGCEEKITVEATPAVCDGHFCGTTHGPITPADTHKPIAGVKVIYATDGAYYVIESDTNGYYRADYLPEATYTFTFRSPNPPYADW